MFEQLITFILFIFGGDHGDDDGIPPDDADK